MDWYAHSSNTCDTSNWQTLKEHLLSVADIAASNAQPLGLERAAYAAGMFHDLGKYSHEFQRRLNGENLRVDHSTAGAKVLCDEVAGFDKNMAEIIGYAILGHHAGLPDKLNETNACYSWRIENAPSVDSGWRQELSSIPENLVPIDVISRFSTDDKQKHIFAFSMLGRMIFSCLVDADYRDTENYYLGLEGRQADRQWLDLSSLLPELTARFDSHMSLLSGRDGGSLDNLRRDVLVHIRANAKKAAGLFSLTVPTGGGKTLASLGFALDHATIHGHRRIIYAIPFTSIIEQTASVFRQVLEREGENLILEHHSAMDEDWGREAGKEARQQKDKLKLAMEDWAAPIVVTTNVQFFESLFAAKTTRARKLHNIAGSIIILDEAQTLPRQYLLPAMRMLEALAGHYGCTVILCTATQPALGVRKDFPQGLALDGRELAPDPQGLANRLGRTTITHGGMMDNDALITALRPKKQALVIVNSRRHALELYHSANNAELGGLVHLTTRLCATHRKIVFDDVRQRLNAGRDCRVIATSLVEAGVDVDFPFVFRAEAGLDQIVQAAGRCNREGKRARRESIVTVFDPPDYPAPREIRSLISDMKRMIGQHDDLLSLSAIEDYFNEVYWRMGTEGLDSKGILDCFRFSMTGTDFAYRSAAEKFRMIESGMVPVIIPYDARARQAIGELGIDNISSGKLARKLQSCIVQVPPKARALLIANGHVRFEHPDLRGDQFAVLQTQSLYASDVGLLWEDADYLAEENMMI